MLIMADQIAHFYIIALTEATSIAELIADFSYLADAPASKLVFDFTHTASNLTLVSSGERLVERLPGHFGFHPLDRTIEQLSFIGRLVEMPLLTYCSHKVSVVLPASSSHLGQFFTQLGVFELMTKWNLPVETRDIWEPKGARDDDTRRVLVPLMDIGVNSIGLPATAQMTEVRRRITGELFETFDTVDAPTQLSEVIGDIVEGIAGLVRGGLVTSLYFPTTGYLELSVMNRTEGTMGAEPDEQLDALVSKLEAAPPAFEKVLEQVTRCYGTLQLYNGFASVLVSPDRSFTTVVERTGLHSVDVPGPRATVVLQLPSKSPILWEPFALDRVATMWSNILN
jgi:hypothetical protein